MIAKTKRECVYVIALKSDMGISTLICIVNLWKNLTSNGLA